MKYSGLSEQTKIIARTCGSVLSDSGTDYYEIRPLGGEQSGLKIWEKPEKEKGCVITNASTTDRPLKKAIFFCVDKIKGHYIEVSHGLLCRGNCSEVYPLGKALTVKLIPGLARGTYIMDGSGSLQSDTEHASPRRESAEQVLSSLKEVLQNVPSNAFPFSTDPDLKNLLETAKDKLGMNPPVANLSQALEPSMSVNQSVGKNEHTAIA